MPTRQHSENSFSSDGRVAAWTAAAVIAVMWIGIRWAAPFAASLPLMVELGRNRQAVDRAVTWRWSLTVFAVAVACIGLIGERAVRSIPFGKAGVDTAQAWLSTGSAVPAIWMLLAAPVVFLVATIATRGFLGCLVLAGIILRTAVFASVIYRQSGNVITATVPAVPLWTLAWLAGLIVLFAPLASWPRIFGTAPASQGVVSAPPRRVLATGGALLALAVVLRIAAAPVYTDLARHLTGH